jgi:hypothetical protein
MSYIINLTASVFLFLLGLRYRVGTTSQILCIFQPLIPWQPVVIVIEHVGSVLQSTLATKRFFLSQISSINNSKSCCKDKSYCCRVKEDALN